MCSIPRRARARPTWVSVLRSTGSPPFGGGEGPPPRAGERGSSRIVLFSPPPHAPEGGPHGRRGLGGDELGVEDPLCGVIDDVDQRLALGGAEGEPGMGAAIEVQHLAE